MNMTQVWKKILDLLDNSADTQEFNSKEMSNTLRYYTQFDYISDELKQSVTQVLYNILDNNYKSLGSDMPTYLELDKKIKALDFSGYTSKDFKYLISKKLAITYEDGITRISDKDMSTILKHFLIFGFNTEFINFDKDELFNQKEKIYGLFKDAYNNPSDENKETLFLLFIILTIKLNIHINSIMSIFSFVNSKKGEQTISYINDGIIHFLNNKDEYNKNFNDYKNKLDAYLDNISTNNSIILVTQNFLNNTRFIDDLNLLFENETFNVTRKDNSLVLTKYHYPFDTYTTALSEINKDNDFIATPIIDGQRAEIKAKQIGADGSLIDLNENIKDFKPYMIILLGIFNLWLNEKYEFTANQILKASTSPNKKIDFDSDQSKKLDENMEKTLNLLSTIFLDGNYEQYFDEETLQDYINTYEQGKIRTSRHLLYYDGVGYDKSKTSNKNIKYFVILKEQPFFDAWKKHMRQTDYSSRDAIEISINNDKNNNTLNAPISFSLKSYIIDYLSKWMGKLDSKRNLTNSDTTRKLETIFNECHLYYGADVSDPTQKKKILKRVDSAKNYIKEQLELMGFIEKKSTKVDKRTLKKKDKNIISKNIEIKGFYEMKTSGVNQYVKIIFINDKK